MTETQSQPSDDDAAIPVPQDLVQAGHDTNEPQADSPESLDAEIAEGANREDIDPHHSIDRPSVDTIDEEAQGAG
ncbi:MAG TPA: hypothetical protein VLF43_04340 [Candidatus Saccharimonadales bacterium]|nr:hypothetical protein [Candidatus Saccharimonadales bacterium]